jgi:hypothetical protein
VKLVSKNQQLALTPPMGWNSFSCYGIAVKEDEVLANARYMATHLAPYGWDHIVVDGMWYQDTIAWISDSSDASVNNVALFNRGEAPLEMQIPLDELGVSRCTVRDLWAKTQVESMDYLLSASVPSHGARLFRITPR